MTTNPFHYVKSINFKNYEEDLSGYVPFLTNRSFAMHMDTILFAEEMNQCHQLGPELQYDFYYYAVRKGNRFAKHPKADEPEHLELIMNHYQYSRTKALQALRILTPDQIKEIINSKDEGGR